MDTKWKNFKYHPILKGVAIVLIVFSIIALINTGLHFLLLQQSYQEEESYFDTQKFKYSFIKKAGYVRDWIVRYSQEDIFTETEDEETLAAREEYFSYIQRELEQLNQRFFYLAKDEQEEIVLTNIPQYTKEKESSIIQEITEKNIWAKGNLQELDIGEGPTTYSNYYKGERVGVAEANRYTIYCYIEETLLQEENDQDVFVIDKKDFDQQQEFVKALRSEEKQKEMNQNFMILCIGGAAFLYLLYASGHSHKEKGRIQLIRIDKIPMEIQALIGLIFSIFIFSAMKQILETFKFEEIMTYFLNEKELRLERRVSLKMVYFLIVTEGLALGIIFFSILRNLKNHSFTQNTLIGRFIKGVRRLIRWTFSSFFKQKALSISYLFIGLLILGGEFILLMIAVAGEYYFLLMCVILFNTLVFLIGFKCLVDFKKVGKDFKRIASGELQHQVEVKSILPALKELVYDMNHVREGLSHALQEMAKKERMKTELITNVSHDLKTPLTSIISYVDLLKAEDISNDKAKEYIQVLDERSERLKKLIEDLIEASKASTGNLKVEMENFKVESFIQQVIGEYTDRLEKNHLKVIFQKVDEVEIAADPKHMWRIMENLLSNIVKHAMPSTRVYIEVKQEDREGVIILRNISKEPIHFGAEELMERFVQGDESRNKEGSGLGLSIASSLALLQKGRVEVITDGDLFKVEVRMPRVDKA